MLDQIRIVLVNTSHAGNIGSAARAMNTMGISELYLVSPVKFPDQKAVEMATSSAGILDKAVVVDTLEEAIADCSLVIGSSARTRHIPWPLLSPRDVAEKISKEPSTSKIAIVFGREQSGLTNEELHRCHLHVNIPTNPDCSSLNLAAAVQVITYELRMAALKDEVSIKEEWDYPFASADAMEKFFVHLEQVLIEIHFLRPEVPRQLMTRFRRLYLRARPDTMEMNMLRGMLSLISDNIANSSSKG